MLLCRVIIFFKQKTAYEMLISDWSSDVCSSDLPRDVVPEANMPAYPWLQHNSVANENVQARMKVLRTLGVPYTDEQIAKAPEQLKGKTEEDALVAYLQGLGVAGRAAAAKAVAEEIGRASCRERVCQYV